MGSVVVLFFVLQDAAGQAAAAAVLESELSWLLQHMDAAGPFALSDNLSLVDCAVVPFLLRLYILEHYRAFQGWSHVYITAPILCRGRVTLSSCFA
jgi:glutathione S-transferase